MGGYVHHEADGTELFIIERQVNGRRFHVSTRCNAEDEALEHFARFRADALGYDPAGLKPDEPVEITVELLRDFLEWQLAPRAHGGKENTAKHARSAVRMLGEWMVALKGRDLRKLKVTDLKTTLKRWKTSRQHRIIAIKAFCGWLREEQGAIQNSEDPSLDLLVPQSDPEKHVRRKVANFDTVLDVYKRLPQRFRDVLQFFAGTGWHISEVKRFVRDARTSIEKPGVPTFDKEGRPVLAVLVAWHKTKKWTRTSIVHPIHLDAIKRLKESGAYVNETKIREAIYLAIEQADVERRKTDPTHQDRPRFSLGVMRHSVATWGIEMGASLDETATHLDHADKSTTDRFYADILVPRPPIPTRPLTVDDDRTLN